MPFKPGQSGNLAVAPRVWAEVNALARQHTEAAIEAPVTGDYDGRFAPGTPPQTGFHVSAPAGCRATSRRPAWHWVVPTEAADGSNAREEAEAAAARQSQ
jgi:hypothetical protein